MSRPSRQPVETFRQRIRRWMFNLFPALVASGGRLTYVAADFSVVELKLKKCLRTRNYVGTLYGGSMYAAVDGIYMVMLIKLLGKGYEVWDKEGHIRYLKPGRSDLFARFVIDGEEIRRIKTKLDQQPTWVRHYTVDLVDQAGTTCAEVTKTLHLRRK